MPSYDTLSFLIEDFSLVLVLGVPLYWEALSSSLSVERPVSGVQSKSMTLRRSCGPGNSGGSASGVWLGGWLGFALV